MAKQLFKCSFGGRIVDLNDPALYTNQKLYGGSTEELWWQCLESIGYVFMYINYFHPGGFETQKLEIDTLCKEFALGEREHRFKDTEENRLWFKNWLFRFEDETENMC